MKRFFRYMIMADVFLLLVVLRVVDMYGEPVRAVDIVSLIALGTLSGVFHFKAIRALLMNRRTPSAHSASGTQPESRGTPLEPK